MKMTAANLLVFTPPPSPILMDGGRVRMHYLQKGLERLKVRRTDLDARAASSPRQFLRALTRSGIAPQLLNPGYRNYFFANGVPPSIPILRALRLLGTPLFLDLHDEPRIQFRDLDIQPPIGYLSRVGKRVDFSVPRFSYIGVVSDAYADLLQVEPERRVIAPNASDPDHFPAVPFPRVPTVSLVGSTSPGRGADMLIDACSIARDSIPDLRLRLALSNIGGGGNLGELKRRYDASWMSFECVDYGTVPGFLAGASVCVVPHRRSRYADLAQPIKLFDYMASGRPVVVTRCREMARIVSEEDCGLVSDFSAEDLARQLVFLLRNSELRHRMGQNGREAVVRRFNWSRTQEAILSVLDREFAADF